MPARIHGSTWLIGGAAGLLMSVGLAFAPGADTPLLLATVVPVAALYLTALVAVRQNPDHPAVRCLRNAAVLFAMGVAAAAAVDALPDTGHQAAAWLSCCVAAVTGSVAIACWFDLFARFPDGTYANAWSARLARLVYVVAVVVTALTALLPQAEVPLSSEDPPPVVVSPLPTWLTSPFDGFPQLGPYLFLFVPLAVIVLLARYPGADRKQRLQMRWPLAAMAFLAVVIVTSQLSMLDFLPSSGAGAQLLWGACVSTVPVALAIGMLRYQLFDLDLVLRRSLVYGLLWLAIAATYVLLAAALGLAAGTRLPVSLAILVALLIAMVFQPARRRLERLADRWVFGERIEGYSLIRGLGASLESSVPPSELAAQLASVLRQGLRSEWVRVSVAVAGEEVTQAWAGEARPQATAELAADLVHDGVAVGRIELGPRLDGDFTYDDEQLVALIGRQAALALTNARLSSALEERIQVVAAQAHELAASRSRLVEAEAVERRRIERDIHDGVQQQLVSLMARLSVARAQLDRDPDGAARTLGAMQAEFRQAVADLRDLASGIHPPVLTDRGFVPAIEALAARIPIGVDVDCPAQLTGRRWDQAIEAAAYFATAEGLTNALKHGHAEHVRVSLAAPQGWLCVSVSDDGIGFDPSAAHERGLRGIRDRIDALGGSVDLHSTPRHGTCLDVRLPVMEAADD